MWLILMVRHCRTSDMMGVLVLLVSNEACLVVVPWCTCCFMSRVWREAIIMMEMKETHTLHLSYLP